MNVVTIHGVRYRAGINHWGKSCIQIETHEKFKGTNFHSLFYAKTARNRAMSDTSQELYSFITQIRVPW